jgi:hypothetical protein
MGDDGNGDARFDETRMAKALPACTNGPGPCGEQGVSNSSPSKPTGSTGGGADWSGDSTLRAGFAALMLVIIIPPPPPTPLTPRRAMALKGDEQSGDADRLR